MSELSFLIELLLNHDLPKMTKDLIAQRIKDVEVKISEAQYPVAKPVSVPVAVRQQAPSTLAAMARHGDIPAIPVVELPPVVPVEQIAQTPEASAGLARRNQLINAAISGQIGEVSTGKNSRGPRKF